MASSSGIRGIWQRIRPVSKAQWAFGVAAIVILVALVVGVPYTWEYTNSPYFCGTTCHTMPPEYNAWQRSPHARVSCVECHIGRDVITTTFSRKAGDLMHVVRYSSGQFNFPVHASSMLPARESCERCHWPEKFSADRSIAVRHYDNDEKNTEIITYLLMKTGGGTQREGRGYGIHWHIENQVYFIAMDELKQSIPWVQVVDAAGKQTTYVDVEQPLPADQIAKAEKQRMDCIDCHNRISHAFRSPEQAVDQALALNRLDKTIPYIHQKATQVLSGAYQSFDDANKAIGALENFYAQNYADYYQSHTPQVKAAVEYLKTLYQQMVFPTQDLSWTTHPDNIGHKEWPGCFRCHDGKHLTQDNQQAIRLECNICHTLPEVAKENGGAPVISLVRADEPDSHLDTTWLAQHRTVFNASCQTCHDTNNAGGKDNSSFCSNSACHGTVWKFAGLNAPSLAKIFPPPVPRRGDPSVAPKPVPHPIGGSPDCLLCHAQTSKVRPYPSDHIGRAKDTCLACHKPAIPVAGATPSATGAATRGGPPPITHDVAGRTQCLGCHGTGAAAVPQILQFHRDAGFGNDKCLTCHKMTGAAQPAATPRPTVAPTAAPTAAPAATVAPTVRPTVAPATASSSSVSSSAASAVSSAASSAASSPGGIKALPANHAGRTTCLACHANGVDPKLPADHAGRTDATCIACHQ